MQYLIFPTEQEAQDRSHQIAEEQGCSGVTQYWFGWINHPSGESALQVDQPELLTEEEVAQLKDYQYMADNGWFPEEPMQVDVIE